MSVGVPEPRSFVGHPDGFAVTVHLLTDDPGNRRRIEGWLDGEFRFRTDGLDPTVVLSRSVPPDVAVVDGIEGGGTAVLDALREGGYAGGVGILASSPPGDAVERMPNTDYVIEPSTEDDVTDLVSRLVRRGRYRELLARDFETTVTLSRLDADGGSREIHGLEVRGLLERKVAIQAGLRELQHRFEFGDYAAILREGFSCPRAVDGPSHSQ